MEKECNFYETISNILSVHEDPARDKEAIKAAIVKAIEGKDYIAAVIAYLWGAYSKGDPGARVAFKEMFFDDLKAENPAELYFFSFYFLNDFRRSGCDRRTGSDRRTAYSLDFFSEQTPERRTGKERRGTMEKRLNWTRVTKWASVPFRADEVSGKRDAAHTLLEEKMEELRETAHALLDDKIRELDDYVTDKVFSPSGGELQPGGNFRNLNDVLSNLAACYEDHIGRKQTDWLSGVDETTLARARTAMRYLLETPARSAEAPCLHEQPSQEPPRRQRKRRSLPAHNGKGRR